MTDSAKQKSEAVEAAATPDDGDTQPSQPTDTRAMRRAAKAAEKARRAQEKADRARAEALAAVRASGFEVVDDDRHAESSTTTPARRDSDPDDTRTVDTVEAGDEESRESAASSLERRRGQRSEERSATDSVAEGNARVAMGLAIAAVILLCIAVGMGFAAAGQNEVKADEQHQTDAPHQAATAARDIITSMFTYDYENVDRQLDAVEPQLTGPAADEYRAETRTQLSSVAKSEQINAYATVAAVGVEQVIDPDHVITLVMLNQMTSTKDQPEAQATASRLRVSMDRIVENGQDVWRVSEIEVL